MPVLMALIKARTRLKVEEARIRGVECFDTIDYCCIDTSIQ